MTSSRPRRFHRVVDGILLLDKPLGLSSNEALQRVRALYGALKAGHGGSLDPLASGLLPVCFGQATKVCGTLLGATKTYRVTLRLGERTASGDLETDIVERAPVPPLTQAHIETVLASFIGISTQVPPMHSALRVDGKRLYELARQGHSIEREARQIAIDTASLLSWAMPDLQIEVSCSKGTYIRSLAEDIARQLGTIAHVTALRRTSVSPFQAGQMQTLEALAEATSQERDAALLPLDTTFTADPKITLTEAQLERFLRGQTLVEPACPEAPQVCVYGPGGRFIGLAASSSGRLQPSRLFVDVTTLV
ncbi:MAG: tRNA pseudouridine(55) synthase TruB, partial [Vicinamibacterales bacterium]